MRRGNDFGVGTVHLVIFNVLPSTLATTFRRGAVNHMSPFFAGFMSYVLL